MADLPLLVFPTPARSEKDRRGGGGGKPKLPHHTAQAERLAPQFARLQQAFEERRLALQGNAMGLQPEQVLVLETVGPEINFFNAIRHVEGLEWLGEMSLDEVEPEHGFQDAKDPEKALKGHVFLVLSDQRAMQEIQRLFESWQQNRDVSFPRGLAPLKNAFQHLYSIRPWSAEDRIRETGVIENWREREASGQQVVPFEIELWHRQNAEHRQRAVNDLRQKITALEGDVIDQCLIPEINYHGLLGNLPIAAVHDFIHDATNREDFQLLRCEDVMYLRPVGQCAVGIPEEGAEPGAVTDEQQLGGVSGLPPVVALLDGLPLTGHQLLRDRLIVDDPDGFEAGYQATERKHGTAMASLICHGDLSQAQPSLSRRLYVRPIMRPKPGFHGAVEHIPDDVLPIDLVHRAVRRLFDPEDGNPPVAPTIKVINLSIGNPLHLFDRSMSAWARLLDWLSWKYQVLFIVSAGNHHRGLELPVPRDDLAALQPAERERAVIQALANDTRHRRLLSPAEALNGLTVGGAHDDASILPAPRPNGPIDPYNMLSMPAVYSAHGLGYNRSIKPDLLFPGGRMLMQPRLISAGQNATLDATSYISAPGNLVAYPGQAGQLDRTVYTRGTSNAAALASRAADQIYVMLEELRQQAGVDLATSHDVVLIKALLAHGARWSDQGAVLNEILRTADNGRSIRLSIGRVIGYGQTDIERVLGCTEQRATILGTGALDHDQADVFRLPLPPSLSGQTVKRRLTITLAWLTPIRPELQKYRTAHLWYSGDHTIATERQDSDHNAVQRGTLQHEIFEGDRAADFIDGDVAIIKVNCRALAGDIPKPIPYALAVTIEVAEGLALPIYTEIRDRLRVRVLAGEGGNA